VLRITSYKYGPTGTTLRTMDTLPVSRNIATGAGNFETHTGPSQFLRLPLKTFSNFYWIWNAACTVALTVIFCGRTGGGGGGAGALCSATAPLVTSTVSNAAT
jgi:hypothetical protein